MLPAATLVTLSALGAVAGPALRCEPIDDVPRVAGDSLSLRVALLASHRRSSLVPAPILAAAYAAENEALDAYSERVRHQAGLARAVEQRRRLYEQAARNAATLGLPSPPPLPEVVLGRLGPRPRIVVADGAGSAIRLAAAGGTGVWLVDERRMPSMAFVGDFYDEATDTLLNDAAAGHHIPIADPNSGRIAMRAFPASVVGALSVADCATLHHAGPAQLLGTVFMPETPAPAVGDSAALVALMCRVRSIGDGVSMLRLPAPMAALVTASAAWAARAAGTQPPLSDYWTGLPDLARRLAALLHLAAAGGNGHLAPQIAPATLRRALALIDACVVPTARAVLGPISFGEVERDARRLIGHLRTIASSHNRVFERRPLDAGLVEIDGDTAVRRRTRPAAANRPVGGPRQGRWHGRWRPALRGGSLCLRGRLGSRCQPPQLRPGPHRCQRGR